MEMGAGLKRSGAPKRPVSGSGTQLLFLDLRQRLAVDAECGGGAGFQTADADLDAAGIAPAVFVLFDQLQRFVDLLDQLALTIACAQFQAEFFFLAGAICRVWEV